MNVHFSHFSGDARLIARNLTCWRGGRLVFNGIDLAVAPGDALLLTGRNGSGKTSLLRILAGLLEPAAGTVGITGGEPGTPLPEQAHFIGAQDGVRPALTVAEHIGFWHRLLGGTGDGRAALDGFGLSGLADTPAGYLSSGQRRRLALSRLFTAGRRLWLLDEPFNALDALARDRLRAAIAAHRDAGGLVVLASHDDPELPDVITRSMDEQDSQS